MTYILLAVIEEKKNKKNISFSYSKSSKFLFQNYDNLLLNICLTKKIKTKSNILQI